MASLAKSNPFFAVSTLESIAPTYPRACATILVTIPPTTGWSKLSVTISEEASNMLEVKLTFFVLDAKVL